MFGPHLILEGYNCTNKAALACPTTIENLLNTLPSMMDMTIIMPPKILDYDGGDIPEDQGVSGFVIIAESHLSIHTFPVKGFFAFDIFSCKDFDIDRALQHIETLFQPTHMDKVLLERGREFPRCISRAADIVSNERIMNFQI